MGIEIGITKALLRAKPCNIWPWRPWHPDLTGNLYSKNEKFVTQAGGQASMPIQPAVMTNLVVTAIGLVVTARLVVTLSIKYRLTIYQVVTSS